ncbi:MAG: glycoside hydrolase family 88 protein [Alistipes sp.]|nr:glycoside hydrolase family 88 protein [Alistipes sp.]
MKKLLLALTVAVCAISATAEAKESMTTIANRVIKIAVDHCKNMDKSLEPGRSPRYYGDGKFVDKNLEWWCSGFYPGTMWYLYEATGDEQILALARKHTEQLAPLQWYNKNHDIGFQIFCSYGNGYRLTGDKAYEKVISNACATLITRYNPTVGSIRSWDSRKWKYAVIVDNMMNLEMLMWRAKKARDKNLHHIAVTHANTTLRNHFREDFSSYHLLDYNPENGEVLIRQTVQGYADESRWARGQAWGLYGFTMMYRFTKDKAYLRQAQGIADMIISYLPKDGIPYWDFNAPDIPKALRDASAGAIIASALIELSEYSPEKRERYLSVAERQLRTLSSKRYLAPVGTNGNFILRHSVGHLPGNSEVDVALTYADYYFIEALMRWKSLK